MGLSIGDIVHGRYRIDAKLGEGGMGAVYRAFDTLNEQPCALKELRLGHLPREDEAHLVDVTLPAGGAGVPPVTREKAAEQFRREAQLLARLEHPNLPKVSDYFGLGDQYYLVMTLIHGQDLARVLAVERGQPLPEERVLGWMEQVIDALAYCHKRGVIHRDVKPANMILTPAGWVYLVDFGIAKPEDAAGHTTVGARATTPGYSPPEQYGGRGRTDARSDIYALGATMYALLTGRDPVEAIDRLQGVELPCPSSLAPAISPQVDAAVMRALALKPADRPQSMAELQAALSIPGAPTEAELMRWVDQIMAAYQASDQGRVRALLDEMAARRGIAVAPPAPAPSPQPSPGVRAAITSLVPQGWRTIRHDHFRHGANGWPTGEYRQQWAVGSMNVTGGEYRWEACAHDTFVSRVRHEPALGDCYVAVDARLISGPDGCLYGLSFRNSDEGDYVFLARKDGCVALRLWYGDAWTDLVNWVRTQAFRRDGANRLAVLAQGPRISLFVNGQRVGEATDAHLRRGTAGLAVSLTKRGDSAVFAFDDFELCAP